MLKKAYNCLLAVKKTNIKYFKVIKLQSHGVVFGAIEWILKEEEGRVLPEIHA